MIEIPIWLLIAVPYVILAVIAFGRARAEGHDVSNSLMFGFTCPISLPIILAVDGFGPLRYRSDKRRIKVDPDEWREVSRLARNAASKRDFESFCRAINAIPSDAQIKAKEATIARLMAYLGVEEVTTPEETTIRPIEREDGGALPTIEADPDSPLGKVASGLGEMFSAFTGGKK